MKKFTVKKEHIKLIQNMWVKNYNECEFGAPAVDPKRPYGNSDVIFDIHYILTGKELDLDKISEQKYDVLCTKYEELHEETANAIQIFFVTGKMEIGTYNADDHDINWKKVK